MLQVGPGQGGPRDSVNIFSDGSFMPDHLLKPPYRAAGSKLVCAPISKEEKGFGPCVARQEPCGCLSPAASSGSWQHTWPGCNSWWQHLPQNKGRAPGSVSMPQIQGAGAWIHLELSAVRSLEQEGGLGLAEPHICD